MRTYVLVIFILYILSAIAHSIDLIGKDYPYDKKIRIGHGVLNVVYPIAFAIWAGIVLWVI